MFLDDELTQILEQNPDMPLGEKSQLLLKACTNRFGNPNDGYTTWVNNVKRTELSWQLFAKKHPEVKPDGLRNIIIEYFCEKLPDIDDKKVYVKKVFGWK